MKQRPAPAGGSRLWRHCLAALATAVCLGGPALAGPPPWPDAEYSYFAQSIPLEKLLEEFASSFSLSLELQPGVAGVVNGRFTARNPTEFISRLAGVYGFSWYTHGGRLYVSPASDNVMRTVPLPAGAGARLKSALIELGLVEPRFGWAELPEQRVVIVSGPATYVRQVESAMARLPGVVSNQTVRVFRLKYASAEDRVITWREQRVRQPGLATVLRELIGGRAAIGSGLQSEQLNADMPGMSPLPALGMPPAPAAVGAPARPSGAPPIAAASAPAVRAPADPVMQMSADPTQRLPSIQSDPRLNALIIQDQPERMPVYADLIARLDIPAPLIEIEAMIVDVNSERARELGINWSLQTSSLSFGFGANGPGSISFASQSGGSTTLGGNAGTQLLAQLRLLETHGDARIQSRPSVLTIDNVSALLDLSETFYIRVLGERVASVTPVTAGTTLKVTPRLIDGPTPAIQLTIDIEDGQIQDRQIDALPTVRRSSVSTQAIVEQDTTLLIAGYAADQNIETTQKVPGLGDLPAIGALFSNKVRSLQKRERLFMIRPKLVSLPGAAAAPTQ